MTDSTQGKLDGRQSQEKIIKSKATDLVNSWDSVLVKIKEVLSPQFYVDFLLQLEGTKADVEESTFINTCIPNGFQLLKTLGQSGSSHIKQILHIPNRNETFGTLDQSYAHLWVNGSPSIKISVSTSKAKEKEKKDSPGIELWKYGKKWKTIIAVTALMEVKILDLNLDLLDSFRLPYSATCLEYQEDSTSNSATSDATSIGSPEIIIGSIGLIMVK